MPKPSSLTLSLPQEQEQDSAKPSTLRDGQQSPLGVTANDISSNARGEAADGQEQSSRGTLEAPGSPRLYSSTTTRSRKPVLGTRGGLPSTVSSNTLDAPQHHLHPYRSSPGSSIASVSHGNLLETASVTSGSVVESVGTSDLAESETAFKSNSLPRVEAEHNLKTSRKPNKQVFQQIMSRSRSIRQENQDSRNVSRLNVARGRFFESSRSRERPIPESPHTAPLEPDRGYREAMNFNSKTRNESADRAKQRNRSADRLANATDDGGEIMKPATSRFATALEAGKGFFGKFSRRGSSNEREAPIFEEPYQIKTIKLPLVEQTRKTRIRQSMSLARDKTEFWLPALPYRCIDFLNLKGTEVEGLYRIPGSVREIKHWQARFDTELDVNLLDVSDLDDVNTVGSLLKAWLRDQPDELIPQAVQKRIGEECADAATTGQAPQFFKDELSQLPPHNYYLLFAITAHLALLQKHSEQNKMDYRNLTICFYPCMSVDAISFQFLVKDWRNCWQGCWTEKEYLEEEYRVMTAGLQPPNSDGASAAVPTGGGLQSRNPGGANTASSLPASLPHRERETPISAQSSPQSRSAKNSSTASTSQRPPRPHALHILKETDMASDESRKPPPAPHSSPQQPQTPTTPSIGPVANVSPLRM